jgi:hypothetical protein
VRQRKLVLAFQRVLLLLVWIVGLGRVGVSGYVVLATLLLGVQRRGRRFLFVGLRVAVLIGHNLSSSG